ncbi:hypothetical protein Q1695_013238 [Nippostrongylus brasiliensis]|nr:hypothetical protein Q1695_013238 [Nippostrongylus brasiliensis]
MNSSFRRLLGFAGIVVVGVFGCSSSGSNDNEWIENPVFTLDVSPPVGWTFFPAISSDNYPIWYFVGQSNLSTEAKQRATAEIESSMLSALTAADMPTYGVVITHDYTPVQVENPTTNTKGVGPLYGKVEGGAITQSAAATTGTFAWVSYSVPVKVSLRNVANTRYRWNIAKNTFMQKLSLNFNARFIGEITITK